MATTGFGGQFYSIGQSGSMLFEQGKIGSTVGGVLVDLISAPIEAGDYRLEISAGVGGIEIFLPHYVQFVIEGGSVFGGQDVHEGERVWKTIQKKLHKHVTLPDQAPDFALAAGNPERPVRIRFALNVGVGGIDIYRL